ncbi:MFS multidrug transporter [Trichophyton equinum CBS 127.97]|uniref:MFS multidrug transporter n=1 Tax=Trichophyton equinum (strain ATCC MYA-4606 / CBS 127.97) TaxID=559882 RepID=F2PV37_TRIEC|nr:MFS multidrug transporter [Trichophyton equinum CBS 127.97]
MGTSPDTAAEKSSPSAVPNIVDSCLDEANPTTEEDSTECLPQNWSESRKLIIVGTISCLSLVVNMSLVICAPATLAIAHDLNTNNNFLLVFYLTAPNLGEAIAPLYIGPLSEKFVTGFSSNINMIIAFRFLAGASTSSICLNPSIIGDLYPVKNRGAAMSVMSLIPILGSAAGPIAGGYITQGLNWRWTFWLSAMMTGVLLLFSLCVMRETYLPVLRQKENNEKISSRSKYFKGWNWSTFKGLFLLAVRPFTILFGSSVAIIMACYLSIHYAYLSLLAATLATTFQDAYGFSESHSGLIYISLTLGTLIGAIYCRFTLDYFLYRGLSTRKPAPIGTDDQPLPENRLIPTIPGMALFPAGLFIYGWSLQYHVHWIVPTLATSLCGFSLASSTTPIMNYLVDIFGDRSASAVAAVLPMRYLVGTFLPVAAPYMYKSLGYGWANSLLAFILLVIVPFPLLAIVQPKAISSMHRMKSNKE